MLFHATSYQKSLKLMIALVFLISNLHVLLAQKNVGINTSEPNSTLEIRSTGETDASSALDVKDASGNSLFFVRDDGRIGFGVTSPGARFMIVGKEGAPTLNILRDLTTGMNPSLRINDNGRVGIGTTSPGARLMVVGEAGAPTMNILHDGANPMNPALRVNENGRIGIG